MTLWVLFAVCVVIEIIFTPLFLKAQWPKACFRSLVLKMICATAFVCIGVLSVFISGNRSTYAVMMLVGLAFGWLGDYFLHAKTTNTYFVIGFCSFLMGHIVYIAAYIRAIPIISPDYNMLNFLEIAGAIVLLAVSFFAGKKFKINFSMKILKYGVLLYAVILITMFIKATVLGYNYYLTGADNGVIAFLILFTGSLFFLLSDATIAILMFGGQSKNKPLKVFNIVTYFAGQALLASSILFINA